MDLPIEEVLPELLAHIRASGRAVLQAPPGAGKTTRVPLALLEAGMTEGRIIVLEPRRLAARAAAARMAETLGEELGGRVGYRIRGEARIGRDTRIEVVTEGILTRMVQADPELTGVGAVIFDEFHERSLHADLGLALCLEVAAALRDDLILLVMSATLDAAPVATMMDAPIVTSQGRSFPVEAHWLRSPVPKAQRFEDAAAQLVMSAAEARTGGILVFLPGEREIRRVQALLSGRLPEGCVVFPLFGAMAFDAQRTALRPLATGRKIVLATSIAETSLTIEDTRIVVDAGRARRARFDPGSGMSRLVTEKVTRAEAGQRAGRAGRVAEGAVFKLWTKGEEGALPAFPPAEIEAADLSGLALELALWGSGDLPFLTPPPEGSLAEAHGLLRLLGALDRAHRITAHGRALARVPLHPRLAHMLISGGKEAAQLAALLAERDPLRGASVDIALRLEALRDVRTFQSARGYEVNRPVIERIRADAKRLTRLAGAGDGAGFSTASQVALAYPDRIGLRRKGDAARYQLSGGKGAYMADDDPLASARLIVVTQTDGNPREARIRQAIAITEAELRHVHGAQFVWSNHCAWSRQKRRVEARQQEMFGAIAIDDRLWKEASTEQVARAMLDGVRDLGLDLSDAARRFAARVEIGRKSGLDLPDMRPEALLKEAEDWLLPHLGGLRSAEDWKRLDLLPALKARLDWGQMQVLDQAVPSSFETPLGRKVPIDYSGDHPSISVRLQELFGQTEHPCVGGTPLRVTLLSPAQRPVQTTLDLPGFWEGSYADVRKDMRARYPRHPWPEDPTQADPTLRAKPRGR